MRKFFIIIALFLSSISISQNKIGIVGGLTSSSISDSFFNSINEFGLSFHFGGVYETSLSDKISFSPKLIFSLQGDRVKTFENGTDYNPDNFIGIGKSSPDYKLTYLNVPLNFKFFNKTYLLAGPQVGFLISTEKTTLDFGDVNKKVDFGLNLGLGHNFNTFNIELNLYQGFTKFMEYENPDGGYTKATNTLAQLSLVYFFKK